ncbi:uncharacterized protein LOC111385262 [Olea europaea var. sylvestris]|uniref:DUF3511 domain protein n=1 Tax=Olea europaea subsp. europaea TaxID=158383 RepID=A0A8S0T6W3_OLEEU|nr:uncharacterized protein LOC111385262 [Olea europaea var. sylvestris]CAA3000661.1 Hypothetical predicted protein [Olea europaea subsp. europaea]
MEDYRSKSYNDDRMQIEPYYGRPSARPTDFRSYSTSYASSSYYYAAPPSPLGQIMPPSALGPPPPKDWKLKKGKSTSGSTSKSWTFNDPEFQRKKRVASYKVYTVEGKVKGSLRKSFRWLKDRYSQVVNGCW